MSAFNAITFFLFFSVNLIDIILKTILKEFNGKNTIINKFKMKKYFLYQQKLHVLY